MAKIQGPTVKERSSLFERQLEAKAARRKELARLPIAEKIEMVKKLRDVSVYLKQGKRIDKAE